MFEVGFTEIVLIFGIALLVLGPKKLPKLAADVGRWAGRARAMARQLRTQLEQEVNQLDITQEHARATPMAPATPAPTIHAPPEPAPAPVHPTPEHAAAPAAAVSDERHPE